MSDHRCGCVAFAGRPNTGKSSLLNRLVGEKLAIVSPKAQTTRHLVTGILNTADAQYVFIDAPGFQTRSSGALNRALNRRAGEAASDAHVVLFVLEPGRFGSEDREALATLPPDTPAIAVVNKIDRLRGEAGLLAFLGRIAKARDWHALVPVSARTGRNLPALLQAVRAALPVAPAMYPPEQLTDRDERFFAAELVREKIFRQLGDELPYRCDVAIDSFREEGRLRRIEAVIYVDRDSHKAIVIGERGARLKRIGTDARRDMEALFSGKVYLGLWVKVREGWHNDVRMLTRLGYR